MKNQVDHHLDVMDDEGKRKTVQRSGRKVSRLKNRPGRTGSQRPEEPSFAS